MIAGNPDSLMFIKIECPSYLNKRLTLLNNFENVEENIVHKNYS